MACGQLRIEQEQDDARQTEVDEALAAVGLIATDPVTPEETFALWPENRKAFVFWQAIQTQWHSAGMGGATGLNYSGVQACMALRGIRKKNRAELFAAVQAMEQAALGAWDKQKK